MGCVDLAELIQPADTKILLVVMDGLGGYADAEHGTELEEAVTPNLDQLAADGSAGLVEPIGPGITPGSGPGHLGLFGYDPEQFELGRGALSAAGLDFELEAGDVAARGNLATLAPDGTITDRRAGRIPDAEAQAVVDRLQAAVHVPGVEVFFRHEREHRLLVALRGAGLDARLGDTDPQQTGVPPLTPSALVPEAKRTADLVVELDAQIRAALADRPQGQRRAAPRVRHAPRAARASRSVTGCGPPRSRSTRCTAGSRACSAWTCSAGPPISPSSSQIMRDAWNDYDYFFLHHKYTDSAGEDGDRARKIAAIETLDAVVPELRALGPDVIVVSGDHSTPSQMAAHSWHPVPTLLWSERCGRDDVDAVRRALVPPRHARHPPHQRPHGPHARQRRPPRQVRRLTRTTNLRQQTLNRPRS